MKKLNNYIKRLLKSIESCSTIDNTSNVDLNDPYAINIILKENEAGSFLA